MRRPTAGAGSRLARTVLRAPAHQTLPAACWTLPAYWWQDLVIYEMSVRCFTADPSSGLPPGRRGTFLGLADKAEYLKKLGVNAVSRWTVLERVAAAARLIV